MLVALLKVYIEAKAFNQIRSHYPVLAFIYLPLTANYNSDKHQTQTPQQRE